ncbi:PAS domain S-box protein [bacterium]|nr:PAS domain S-box protein [bacterium]
MKSNLSHSTPRFLMMGVLLLVCIGLEYYFHMVRGISVVYTHLFYIPIVVAALWWGLKGGLSVSLFLGLIHTISDIPGIHVSVLTRALAFVSIGFVIGIVSDRRKQTEKKKERLLQDINERVKELDCFYGFSALVEKADISLEGIFQGMVELLPTAWRYPDITCAKIAFEDKEFKTEGFKTSKWKQSADIKVHGERVGIIEVYYLEEKPKTYEGPFLKQERKLIDSIAERLGRITERRKAEEELRVSEHKYRVLLENLPQKIFYKDRNSVYVSCNENYARDLKIKPDAIVGKTDFEFYPKELAGKYKADDERIVESGKIEEIEEKYIQEGKEMIVQTVKKPIKDEQGNVTGILGIFRDITERKRMEEELRKNEEKYRDLWENVNDLIQSVKPDGTFVYVNRAWRKTLGYSEKEIPYLSLLDIIHPDSHAHCMEIFKRLLAGEKVEYIEAAFLTKDGNTIMVEGSANCHFVDGKPVATRAIFRDISEHKKAEERKVEFLSNVSHALRTPLASIKSFVEILLKYKDVNPTEQSEFLTVINNETDRLTRLINQLLDLDKIEHGKLKWKFMSCDISNIVQNAISELEPLIQEKNIVVNMNLPSQDLIVNGDKDRLNEVFINLIGNAIKFTLNKREIRITVKNKGKVVEVSIADTGIGIPKNELTNIFERFKRLDNSVNRKLTGTGLGLYICKQIIEKHEGKIWAESQKGKGSKFVFVLPKYKSKSAKKRIKPKRGS